MVKLKTNFRKAEDSPGFLLWKTSNLLQRLHTECLKDLNVTPAQFSLMTCLVYLNENGPVTAARIVAHTGMDKMMVSDLVKTLEGKRLIRRKDNPDDGRSFIVEPTRLGEKITNSAVLKVEEVDAGFFKRVRNAKGFHADLLALLEASTDSR
jgi:DNA-binding MarR family transcriptional regulator